MTAQAEEFHTGVAFEERLRRAKERRGVEAANRQAEQVNAVEKLAKNRKEAHNAEALRDCGQHSQTDGRL